MKVMITGTFDPITKGHLDIIKRATTLFGEVVVAILVNDQKQSLFDETTRKQFIEQAIKDESISQCTVVIDQGLAVDCARKHGCAALVRGIRSSEDAGYELTQATVNQRLNPKIETLFITASSQHAIISSTMVKSLVSFGANVDDFVPAIVAKALYDKIKPTLQGTKI